MVIEYADNKDVKCYRDYVLNPDNPIVLRAFRKAFGVNLMSVAKKLHDRLKQYKTAGEYNIAYGKTNNRIEIKQGKSKKEPLVFKVRVDDSWRKFFHSVANENGDVLLTQNWTGDFNSVATIFVIAINNHDYKKV